MTKRFTPIRFVEHVDPSPRSRIVQLDVLRALAILLVLGRHMAPPLLPVRHSLAGVEPAWLREILTTLGRGGWVGVDLFFVLSGFLVSGLIFRERLERGTFDATRFLLRRGFKIYPAFYTLVIAVVGFASARGHTPSLRVVAGIGLFAQNYLPWALVWGGANGHLWSLCIEEHFYIGLAVTLWLLSRATGSYRAVPAITAVAGVVCLAIRCSNADVPFDFVTHLTRTHIRVDSLLFGVLLGYWYHHDHDAFMSTCVRFRGLFLALGVALLAPAFGAELGGAPFLTTYGYTLFYLGSGALLCGTLAVPMRSGPLTRVLSLIGRHSYSIYLWHWPILLAFVYGSTLAPIPLILAYLAMSLGVGIALAELIEFPALALRDRVLRRS